MWREELLSILKHVGQGTIAPVAYDTAWVACLPHPDDPTRPAFPAALQWLWDHQREDGSWGADTPYYHDRILSTLMAAVALSTWMNDRRTRRQVDAAQRAVWQYLAGLRRDPYDTIGFELILPTLLKTVRQRGFHLPYSSFDHYARVREAKLAKIPPALLYSPRTTTTFSLEFMGDGFDPELGAGLLIENGSIAASPSATAYYLTKAPEQTASWEFLEKIVRRDDGGVPAVAPIDMFEPAWVLYNILTAYPEPAEVLATAQLQIQHLRASWKGGEGSAMNSLLFSPDLDCSSVVFRVLSQIGMLMDPRVFLRYEEQDHFWCYPYERDPSISAHVHLLEALHVVGTGLAERERLQQKALGFLDKARTLQTFWFDKWHASPYYTTAHAVMALGHDADNSALVADALYWIANTQNPDGSWGHYQVGTAEETAYCLQALLAYRRDGGKVDRGLVERAAAYLIDSVERKTLDYRPLWIGKSLYTPTYVVHSAVLSALAMYEDLC